MNRKRASLWFGVALVVTAAWWLHAQLPGDPPATDATSPASPASPAAAAGGSRASISTQVPALARESPSTVRDPRRQFDLRMQEIADHHQDAPIAPAEARRFVTDSLVESGSSSEAWTRHAAPTFRALQDEMTKTANDLDIKVGDIRCYAAGCIARISYANPDYHVASGKLAASAAILSWPGAKLATPSVPLADGRAESDFVLLRPGD